MSAPEQSEASQPRTPIPLYVGLGGTALIVCTFACAYFYAGDTTSGGWYATLAAGFELAGVLLVASPELRPIVEELGRRLIAQLRTWPRRLRNSLRRLLHKPIHHELSVDSGVYVTSGMELDVQRGFENPPPQGATPTEQLDYLLRVTERFKGTLNLVENDLRRGIEDVGKEISRTAIDLTEKTTDAVRQQAQAELRMRLLGVACITLGLMLAYFANIA